MSDTVSAHVAVASPGTAVPVMPTKTLAPPLAILKDAPPPGSPLSSEIPQTVIDALNAAQSALDAKTTAAGAKAATASALSAAQVNDQSAASTLAAAQQALVDASAHAATVLQQVYGSAS